MVYSQQSVSKSKKSYDHTLTEFVQFGHYISDLLPDTEQPLFLLHAVHLNKAFKINKSASFLNPWVQDTDVQFRIE